MRLRQDELLTEAVADEILKVADLTEDLTRSDLQGVASATARKIIELIREQSVVR